MKKGKETNNLERPKQSFDCILAGFVPFRDLPLANHCRVRTHRALQRSCNALCSAGLVVLAGGLNPIPFRTRPLNPPAPMVLHLKMRESRSLPGLQSTVKIRSNSFVIERQTRPNTSSRTLLLTHSPTTAVRAFVSACVVTAHMRPFCWSRLAPRLAECICRNRDSCSRSCRTRRPRTRRRHAQPAKSETPRKFADEADTRHTSSQITDIPTFAGWSSPVARQAHNLKVVSSNLAPATTSYINRSS